MYAYWENNKSWENGLFLPWRDFGLWLHDHDVVVVKCCLSDLLYLLYGVVDVHGVMLLDFVGDVSALTDLTVFFAMICRN